MLCKKCSQELPLNALFCPFCGIKQITPQKRKSVKKRGNGQGCVYKLPSGKWKIQITLGYTSAGKRLIKTKSGFKTKKEALDYIPILKNDASLNKKVTLNDLYNSWSESYFDNISKSKQDAYKIAFKKIEKIAFIDIRNLKLNDLQNLINKTPGEYYPKRDIKALLSKLYNIAEIDNTVQKNLAKYLILPPLPASKRDAFTAEEIKKFWDHYPNEKFIGFILIMIYTGMRFGELQQLYKADINLKDRIIIGAGIKTDKGKNTPIVIAEKIIPIIEENMIKGKFVKINEKSFYKKYYEILEKLNIRRLTPYSCRHTTATALALENVSPAIIKQIMRHSKYETTSGYTHIKTDEMLKAIDIL